MRGFLRNVGATPETWPKVRNYVPKRAVFRPHLDRDGVYLRAVADDDPPPSKEQIDAAWRSVERAMGRAQQSLPPNEPCVFCGGAITVEGLPPSGPYTSWIFGCPCGKTSGSLKGL
jgi:hypothetical protein